VENGLISISRLRGLAYYTGKVFELFDAKGEFHVCGAVATTTSCPSSAASIFPRLI
jgi:hypothetical protein